MSAIEQIKEAQALAVKAATEGFETKFAEIEDQLTKANEANAEMKNLIADLEQKSAPVVTETSVEEVKFDQKALNEKLRTIFTGDKGTDLANVDTKALAVGGTGGEALAIDEELGRRVIERARENVAILGLIGSKSVSSVNYREMVLRSYPGTAKGVENVAGTNWNATATQKYEQVVMQVAKQYAKPQITHEAAKDPHIDLMAHLESLLAEEMSRYWALQVLFGDGKPDNLRGILSSKRIDDVESLKSNAERDFDFYPVRFSGDADGIGGTTEAIVDNMIDMTIDVPTMYLANSKFVMNRRTMGVLRKLKVDGASPSTDARPLLQFEAGGFTLIGHSVVIEDYMPDLAANSTPVIFGDLSRAYVLIDIDDEYLVDPYSTDGVVTLKSTSRKGEIVQNNDAIVVLKCKA